MGRLLKMAGVGLAGIAVVTPLAVAAVVGLVFLVLWLTQDSPATHARKAVQSLFDAGATRTANVKSCTLVGSDEEARIYRCRIVTPGCVRTHRFAIYRQAMYGVAPYAVTADIASHPCRYPSD